MDEALVRAYQEGDEDAAAALFERFYDRLIAMIGKEMNLRYRRVEGPSDVAQSALRSFFRCLREGRIEIAPDGSLWPLLAAITLNKIRNRAKYWTRERRNIGREVALETADPLLRDPTPQEAAELKDFTEALLAAFPPRRRRILELLLAGYTISEIAAELNTSRFTIYNTRKAAQDLLAPHFHREASASEKCDA